MTPAQAVAQANIISQGITVGRYLDLYVCVQDLCNMVVAVASSVPPSLPLPLPISSGGTGSATQNFVDLTSNQNISGSKYFIGNQSFGSYLFANVIETTSGIIPGNNSVYGTAALYGGNGAPSVNAPNGSLYLRYDGSGSTLLYQNQSGASSSGNTWTALAIPALPLSVANGGTGTASPGLVQGTGISLSGSFPAQTVALSTPVSIANGGTGSTSQNFVDLTTGQTVAGNKLFSGVVGAATTGVLLGTSATPSATVGTLIAYNATDTVGSQGFFGTAFSVRNNTGAGTAGALMTLDNNGALVVKGPIGFGGAYSYFSDSSCAINGPLSCTYLNNAQQSYVPPVYTASGGAVASTMKIVTGSTASVTSGGVAVTLTNAAVFTSSSSYMVICTPVLSTATATSVTKASGSSFTLYCATTQTVNWIAIGT